MTNKLLMGAAIAVAMSASFSSCTKDEKKGNTIITPPALQTGNVIVSSNITVNTTWTKDKVYQLAGRIAVEKGVTLTIEAGTVIKGEAGTGTNATALLIAQGAKIMAEGTVTEPIVFTSVADEFESGDIASPNLDPDQNGFWGGLIVLGYAPISASVSPAQIEGIPSSDPNGLYGGSDPSDNSGIIKYVSVRHGGANIGAGNEINGISLGGVGNGTVIENVEIVANQDDGIEFFGGTVNVKNAISWNVGDDGFDTDQAWSGTLDNFIVVTPSGHSLELDGPEGSLQGSHTIKNGTIIASDTSAANSGDWFISEDLINTDQNTGVSLENIHIMMIAPGQVINRTIDNLDVTFTNVTLAVNPASLGNYIGDAATAPAGISASTTAAATGKANAGVFTAWTWAAAAGMLNGL